MKATEYESARAIWMFRYIHRTWIYQRNCRYIASAPLIIWDKCFIAAGERAPVIRWIKCNRIHSDACRQFLVSLQQHKQLDTSHLIWHSKRSKFKFIFRTLECNTHFYRTLEPGRRALTVTRCQWFRFMRLKSSLMFEYVHVLSSFVHSIVW